ncbi:hypothetical protein [Terrisporobacter mayombei]|uniref:Uncharacterized protein n=1 Tax=Terrisporobacter mayombei TaxID=1541 RepID=A0ABY9Q3Y1_9FIRM|nr:hypothetical protein [Terrisporobacter mayombei]MCC3867683.1 hypothetical protein [Terrisporobacter mayombei]WMT81945.1 hypothetical protein TEMA_22950 [Terrisporobacter mayombei]
MNNLLLILAMMVLSNGNVSLFDNKNKSNKPAEESTKVDVIEPNVKSNQNKRSGPTVRKVKKIKKKTRSKDPTRERKNDPIKNILKFDITDVNKGINLMDLSEEDLDRGMEIITRTKKYMNKEERNILIKLESVLDLVKGIKKLNDINILSEGDESEFFRSMDEEDKKNMMIKEIIEVFPEKKKQSVEKALEMKKMIDLFAELFLPDGEEGGGFSLSSLADINNLGSISNLKLLGSLLRSLDDDEEEEEKEYEYVEVEEDDVEDVEEENSADDYDEYLESNKAMTNNKKYSKSKSKKSRNRRKKQM